MLEKEMLQVNKFKQMTDKNVERKLLFCHYIGRGTICMNEDIIHAATTQSHAANALERKGYE